MPTFFQEIKDVHEVSEDVKKDAQNIEARARTAMENLEDLIEEINELGVEAERVEKICERIVSQKKDDTYEEDRGMEPKPSTETVEMIAEMSKDIDKEEKIEGMIEGALENIEEHIGLIESHITRDGKIKSKLARLDEESEELKEAVRRKEAGNDTVEGYNR